MKRRPTSRGTAANARKPKSVKPARASTNKPSAGRTFSNGGPEQVARLERDLNEALEQQAASSEILKVISSSPGELQPVFHAILESATRICEAKFGNLWLREGDAFRIAATHGAPPAYRDYFDREPLVHPHPKSGLGVVLETKRLVHIADIKAESTFRDKMRIATIELAKARSLVGVALLKADEVVGAIAIYRQEVRPFTDKQIELLQNFAAQAVIAIENARLLNELRDSLQQQTAAAEVLKVITSSPGDLAPIFETLLTNAITLCGAKFGNLFLCDDDKFTMVAMHGAPAAASEWWRNNPTVRPGPHTGLARLVETKQVNQTEDLKAGLAYAERDPLRVATVELAGARTLVDIPLLKDDVLIGAIVIYRQEVRLFTDKEVELLQNFAAQAVIAIENARLLSELRESLEQQTATSEVLRVISTTVGNLKPVFDEILEHATRICEATFGSMLLCEGDGYRRVSTHNAPVDFQKFSDSAPVMRRGLARSVDRAIDTGQMSHILDVASEDPSEPIAKFGGARTLLVVPMRKNSESIGVLGIYRQEIRPFTDKQIALVQNFAAQAVIAIENARLLNELRESLRQQTAAADVLRIIASSPGELDAVFNAMLENARHICDAKFGILMLRDGDGFRSVAIDGAPDVYTRAMRENSHIPPRPGSGLVVLVETKKPVQIADVQSDAGYVGNRLTQLAGARTLLIVPMLKDDTVIGAINIYRQEVRSFTEQQIALLQNFAAQAVIAIENARLLSELRESLELQTATSEVLKVISSSPGELEPVFSEMLESATRICEAKLGTLFLYDGNAFRVAAGVGTPPELAEFERLRGPFRPELGSRLERVVATKQVIHILDDAAEDVPSPPTRLAGARSIVAVPMLKDDVLIGAIAIFRKEVRPFAEKQIALLVNFAAQAVIAIENARLLNELRESLEQQTASADVLGIISSSPGDLEPVFATILDKALHLCEAAFGVATTYDGKRFECAAERGVPDALAAYFRAGMDQPRPGDAHWRLAAGEDLVHNLDQKDEDAYRLGNPLRRAVVDLGGARSTLVVALRKDKLLLGALTVYRKEVRPFTDQQISLLQNFAAQAVIAIENARLLSELRQRTQELEMRSREIAKLNQQLEARVADQVGEIERMGRLRRFLPPQVADLIVASGAEKQLESHRREITALFCDLRGFTGFSESSDPEDVMMLLRQYHEAIGEIIIKYSGTLERYAGDGVMVVFNDPVPVDNPALQAVRMALDMRSALGGLIEKWRRLGHELGFGIGIAHGYATLGTIGFEGRFDYAAIGTVSNVASRLCDEAKPGQILISPRVLMAVEDAVAVEPVGDFALKGISRPLAAYNVVGPK